MYKGERHWRNAQRRKSIAEIDAHKALEWELMLPPDKRDVKRIERMKGKIG